MRVQEALEVLKGLKGWQDPDTVYLAGKFLGAYQLAETFKDGSRFHEARYAARSAMDDLGRLTALKLGEIAEACRVIERELSAYELLPDVSGSRKINRSAGDVAGEISGRIDGEDRFAGCSSTFYATRLAISPSIAG